MSPGCFGGHGGLSSLSLTVLPSYSTHSTPAAWCLINIWPLRLQPPKSSISTNPITPMASAQKVTVIIDGTNTWHDWLEVIKTKARAGEVWEYVDPSLAADQVEQLVAPRKPKPSDIKAGAVSPIDLNDDELKKLLQLQLTVKPELKEYELKRKALNEMVTHI